MWRTLTPKTEDKMICATCGTGWQTVPGFARRRTLLDLCALPLADAGPARVGEHGAADLVEDVDEAVALDGRADLLAAGRDRERHLHKPQPEHRSTNSSLVIGRPSLCGSSPTPVTPLGLLHVPPWK